MIVSLNPSFVFFEQGRSLKMYADGGKKAFNFDNLYFSLYPEVDMSVKITISFGEDKSASEAYLLFKK